MRTDPNGRFAPTPDALHPNGNNKKCLDVRGAVFANGTPVQIYDCNQTPAQQWVIRRGNTRVRLAGTNFCLDAGSSPANGVELKIWECFSNLPAQEWVYTDDNRIALEGQGFCVDLTGGDLTNGNPVQEWKCTDFDANQIWTQPTLLD
ncbi:carbohydrate-binding module family 13 protein [Hebeloma cylindrosporum]|uniref:Carbohydrate-binding module family 13 protein n=1 Tax=Hebeloma cylindrosporum TaxID=76867 RepID=A0A0C3BFF1_HEBCY|nr:carbohydrate-binding module family 13 protein [Hebeloma cylindrosporum h7]